MTLTDRKSRFELAKKVARKKAELVKEVMRNRREQEMEIYHQFMRDDSFQKSLIADLQRAVNVR